MSVRLLVGYSVGDSELSVVLVDSESGMAFGPVLSSEEQAERFLAWFYSGEAFKTADALGISSIGNDDDPRGYRSPDLHALFKAWKKLDADGLVSSA